MRRLVRGTRLAGSFLASQGAVQLANFAVGISLVHLLSVDQYALFTLASTLLIFFSLATNPGISQAVITQAATVDEQSIGRLMSAALAVSRRVYLTSLPLLIVLSTAVFMHRQWPVIVTIAITALVASTAWIQVVTTFRAAILNTRHDVLGLFQVGISEAVVRLVLVPLCLVWPYAIVAVGTRVAADGIARLVSRRALGPIQMGSHPEFRAAIWRFIVPLAPLTLYSALQGQIAVLALNVFGSTTSIAEYGAVTRLGQLVSFFILLNPFLVQPVMARQHDRAGFVWHLSLVVGGLTALSIVVMLSVFEAPNWWLFILGDNYAGLQNELPLAVGAALLGLIGATLYAVVSSRNCTAGQPWVVVLSLAGQLSFLGIHGIRSVSDGLVLGGIAAVSLVFVETILIAQILRNWSSSSSGAPIPPASDHQQATAETNLSRG